VTDRRSSGAPHARVRKGILAALPLALSLWAATPTHAQLPSTDAGTPADGKAFRILDRIVKEVDKTVLFDGSLARSVTVNKAESGGLTVCINCQNPPASAPQKVPQDGSQKAGETVPAQLGNLLLCDLSRLWNPGYAEGAFVYVNDAGFDADDREYEAFPVGGPDTGTTRVGPLLFVADQKPDLLGPDQPGWSPFQLALRRSGTTYLSPLDGGTRSPRRLRDEEAQSKDDHAAARSHHVRASEWMSRYRPSFSFGNGAAANTLTNAIVLFATGDSKCLLVLDLRKFESKQASYFWAPFHYHQDVHLDDSTVTVEGESDGKEVLYEPTSYVEYPFLIVLGEYARIRVAGARGGPEMTLDVGSCDKCP